MLTDRGYCIKDQLVALKISAEVKEGPADCIRMDEVRAALKKMKRHKAPIVGAGNRNDTSHRRY